MGQLQPPVGLALASPARDVPVTVSGGRVWAFEPKVDGWRAAWFARAGVLQSRQGNDVADRFPELSGVAPDLGDVVLDGEIVALKGGSLNFPALASRPSARAQAGVVVYFVAFDILATGRSDLRSLPYQQRRERLERLFADLAPPLQVVPSTRDRAAAMAWMRPAAGAAGVEGLVAKLVDAPYRPGRTGVWVKVRQMTVVDAWVIGATGDPRHPVEVVLARPDETGELRPIGLSLPLAPRLREQIGQHLTPTGDQLRPVSTGVFGRSSRTEYQPVLPALVVEVEVEAAVETFTNRLRPRVHRARPDLAPMVE